MIIKDIIAGKKYIAKSGEEKTRWTNIGSLFIRDDGKMVVKMNAYINPLAFANEKGDVWFNVFNREEKGENAPKMGASSLPGGEPEKDVRERVVAEAKGYSAKWKEQDQEVGYEPDGWDGCEVE